MSSGAIPSNNGKLGLFPEGFQQCIIKAHDAGYYNRNRGSLLCSFANEIAVEDDIFFLYVFGTAARAQPKYVTVVGMRRPSYIRHVRLWAWAFKSLRYVSYTREALNVHSNERIREHLKGRVVPSTTAATS